MNYHSVKFGIVAFLCQLAFLLIYGFRVKYADHANASTNGKNITAPMGKFSNPGTFMYPQFEDMQMMMLIGFAYVGVYLRRYGFSSIGFNFMLVALVIQWSIVMQGVGYLDPNDLYIVLGIPELIKAQYTVAAVLVTFGAVAGKLSPLQLLCMAMIEVPIIAGNEYCGRVTFMAVDVGESIFIHMFGAYFGLACAWVLYRKHVRKSEKEESVYNSDIFSILGTLVLWVYFPSFNSAMAQGDGQPRAVINTVVCLSASTLSTFIIQSFLPEKKKEGSKGMTARYDMFLIQNATISGGIAVGSVADMMIQPWGAMLIGVFSAIITTICLHYLTPALKRIWGHDTRGVHSLHGISGLTAGFASCVASKLATEEMYGDTLFTIFPGRIPQQNRPFTYTVMYGGQQFVPPNKGLGRSGHTQALYQLAAIAVTFIIAVGGGVLTGLLLRIPICNRPKSDSSIFDDQKFWVMPKQNICYHCNHVHGTGDQGVILQHRHIDFDAIAREGNYDIRGIDNTACKL